MPRVVSTGWAMAPWPLLDQITEPGGKQRLCVYLWLHRYGNGRQEGCWASVQTLADKCGMKPAHVKAALRWLLEAGWIERVSRPGQTSHYFVKADAPQHNPGPKRYPGAKKDPGTKKAPPTRGPKGTQVPKGPHDLEGSSLSLTSKDQEKTFLEGATLQAAQPTAGAQPVQGILLTPDTPVANTGSQAKRNASPWPIPPEFAQFSELLDAWLDLRLVVNPHSKRIDPWGKRQRSAGALRLAIAKGVAVPFLEEAAERGWVSLGHPDHKRQIERLAAPVTALPRSRFSSNPNPQHPTLQPYVRTAC